ncbi:MAG TPA: hypothetical protein VF690_12660 [Hymenobacter sp.]|jgi:hypothetical protein
MTVTCSSVILLLVSALVPLAAVWVGAAGAQAGEPARVGAPVSPATGRVVVTVDVPAPWYAFDFVLPGQFKKVLPTYQRLDGLRFKAFSIHPTQAQKLFGGIYLWDSEAQARQWFTPAWVAEVARKRGHQPSVRYYPLVSDQLFVAAEFDYRAGESESVTVFVHGVSPALRAACLAAQPGLLRSYLVRENGEKEGALLLFAAAHQATAFLKRQQGPAHDWFKTPVLLNNAR